MSFWRNLTLLGLMGIAGHARAQDGGNVTQMNKLRAIQNQISQDAADVSEQSPAPSPWSVAIGSGGAYTSNAYLTSGGAKGDFYTTNSLGLRRQSDLANGFNLSSGLEVTDFRYLRYPKLSMTFLDWDLSLGWSGSASGFEMQGYLSHTLEWTQQRSFREQTLSSIVALGGSVSRSIAAGHDLSVATELSVTPYTSPSANTYGCLSLSTSYSWKITSAVAFKLSALGYETIYFSGERDFTTSCSATVTWSITSWLAASAYVSPSWNSSTKQGANYTAVDSGVNVLASWKF